MSKISEFYRNVDGVISEILEIIPEIPEISEVSKISEFRISGLILERINRNFRADSSIKTLKCRRLCLRMVGLVDILKKYKYRSMGWAGWADWAGYFEKI